MLRERERGVIKGVMGEREGSDQGCDATGEREGSDQGCDGRERGE